MQLGGRKWEIRIVVPKVIDRRAELTCQRPGFVDGQRSHPRRLDRGRGSPRPGPRDLPGRLRPSPPVLLVARLVRMLLLGRQFRADCAHLRALRLVVAEPAPDEPADLTAEQLRREQDEANRVRNGARWSA
jgi:hypothetical protein